MTRIQFAIAAILVPTTVLSSRLHAQSEWSNTPLSFESESDNSLIAFATDDTDLDHFASMSIEELMNIEVTSVAGVAQEWFKTPAAMYVITNEDIKRTGHRSIAELLRLSPGLFVGRTDANTWSIGSRGFNSGFGNKMLVLIDGRTTYDLLFSGTFWDVQDTLLEDIERIEVIRGPGATLWGANAVNGVINITTKHAKDTQGLYLGGGAGNEERGFGEFRYGTQINENAWYRVWGKFFDRDSFDKTTGMSGSDDWAMTRAGFRFDFTCSHGTNFTVQGDGYHTDRVGETTGDAELGGGNILFRASQEDEPGTGWSMQGYFDRTERALSSGFVVDRNTFDVDFRKWKRLGESHELIAGVGYRNTADRTEPFTGGTLFYSPASRRLDTVSAFLQDTIHLSPERLHLQLGSKFEYNDVTGFEYQPGARLSWTPNDTNTLWGAVSRPVRTPSRTEDDLFVPASSFEGNPHSESEVLTAYEVGYRINLKEKVSIDIATFYNDYDKLISTTLSGGTLTFENAGEAQSHGVEVAATWEAKENWRLQGSYSFFDVDESNSPLDAPEGRTPQQMAQVRSYLDLTNDVELNTALYYVDKIPAIGIGDYLRFDLGITWHVNNEFDIAFWGQHLLDEKHPESSSSEVERAFYVMGSIRF